MIVKITFILMFSLFLAACGSHYGDFYHYKNHCGYNIIADDYVDQIEIDNNDEGVIYFISAPYDIGDNSAKAAKERLKDWNGDEIVTALINVETNQRREISGNELASAFSQDSLIRQGNTSDWLIGDVRSCPDSRNITSK